MSRSPVSTRTTCKGVGLVALNQKRTHGFAGSSGGSCPAVGRPHDAARVPPAAVGLPARIPLVPPGPVPPGLRLLATALISEVANKGREGPVLQHLHHLRLEMRQEDLRRDRLPTVADDL